MGNKEGGCPVKEGEFPVQEVASVLLVREVDDRIEFLLARIARGKRKLEQGRYSPPGGRVEVGAQETPAHCAIREVKEEAGLKISEEDLILFYKGTQTFARSRKAYYHWGYLVRWQQRMGEPQNPEPNNRQDWEWLSASEVKALDKRGLLSLSAQVLTDIYLYESLRVASTSDQFWLTIRSDTAPRHLPDSTEHPFAHSKDRELHKMEERLVLKLRTSPTSAKILKSGKIGAWETD